MNALIKATAKRYRYTGKERDEESGLYYHGARYYIPWLCRWSSVDPINSGNYNLQKGYGLENNLKRSFLELTASPYEYCYDNPTRFNDPNGEQVPPGQIDPIKWWFNAGDQLFKQAEIQTTQTINDTLVTSLLAVAYTKAPQLMALDMMNMEIPDEWKEEVFGTDYEASVGILLYEFATGTGPDHRDFYYDKSKPNSFANKVLEKESYVFKDIIAGIYRRVEE